MAELLSGTQITALRSFIDIVRSNNVQVDLPSIVVCGATSSGKSSLLSAISGVILPSDSDICTKCPASICMENLPTTQCRFRILWSETNAAFRKKSSNSDIRGLEAWETCEPSELTNKIKESQSNILKYDEIESGVSSSVIDISISGPNHPNLTIIDLPGIVKTVGEGEDKQIKQQIDDLIDSYIRNPLCIILVVHPADVDFHNSEMFERAKKYDPDTKRTFPVITKADKIAQGEEKNVIKLVSGGFVTFSLGFHLVKLRSQQEIDEDCSADSVVKSEMEWFKSSRFKNVQHTDLSVVNLRHRLAKVYIEHLNSNIQKVIDCIAARRQLLEKELESLGFDVSTEPARNRILTAVTQRIVGKLCGYGALTSKPFAIRGQAPLVTIRAVIEYHKQQLVKGIIPRELSDLACGDIVNKVIDGVAVPCIVVSRCNPTSTNANDEHSLRVSLIPQTYTTDAKGVKWDGPTMEALVDLTSSTDSVFPNGDDKSDGSFGKALVNNCVIDDDTDEESDESEQFPFCDEESDESEEEIDDTGDSKMGSLDGHPSVKVGDHAAYVQMKGRWYRLKIFNQDSLHLPYDNLVQQINSHRHSPMAIFEGEPVFHDHVRKWVGGQVREVCSDLIELLRTMVKGDINVFASTTDNHELQLYPRLNASISEAASCALELWVDHLECDMCTFLDQQMDPATLNHYFSNTIIKLRHQPLLDCLLTKQRTATEGTNVSQVVDVASIEGVFHKLSSKNVVEFVAEETAISLRAYYKVARKNIADGVANIIDHSLKFDKAPSSYQHSQRIRGKKYERNKNEPRDLAGVLRDQFSKIDCSSLFTNNAAAARRAAVEGELEGLRNTLKQLPRLRASFL